MVSPRFVVKKNGRRALFDENRITRAVTSAAKAVHLENPDVVVQKIVSDTLSKLPGNNGRTTVTRDEIEETLLGSARGLGYVSVAHAYETYRDQRARANEIFIVDPSSGRSTTDAALMIASDSKDSKTGFTRERIVEQLEKEASLAPTLAIATAKDVEIELARLYDLGLREATTTQVRAIVDLVLSSKGLGDVMRRQEVLGMPTRDLESLIFSKNQENSNVSINNPEAVNLGIAEHLSKQWALQNIFGEEVTEAHRGGRIHVHDLGYPVRTYCSAHSLEFLKKYGLNKTLPNLESKSNPPNSAAVLNGHLNTFLASKQADYAGALGWGFFNILYSPLLNRPVPVVTARVDGRERKFERTRLEEMLATGIYSPKEIEILDEKVELRDLTEREYKQIAQEVIFNSSQNAFSRGGQTLFIDFNVHAGVPRYLRNVPVIGPGGKYEVQMPDDSIEMIGDVPRFSNPENPDDPRADDANDAGLEGKLSGGHIITYGDLESSSQKFAHALLQVWREGDKDGRPFHFPKCDFHVSEESFENPGEREVLDHAFEVASENGSVYFLFDRGEDAVLAQCCRLKQKIEDPKMLKHPEKLRFCGFQNVTINVPQASYRGKDLEGTLREIDGAMDLALQAHLDKREFIQGLLDTDGSPLRGAGKPCDDGEPYIDLSKATYIMGMIGLNETVQVLTGKQLHESEEAYRTGLEIVSHMYHRANELRRRTGMNITLEESPAESATRRLSKVDLNHPEFGDEAQKVVKGTQENPYYTNSIHFAPGADVGMVDRIVGQSKFHEMIASGAIVHAWIGENRPDKGVVDNWVRNTLENTRCSQFVVSPTYTECDECGTVLPGEPVLCKTPGCRNADEKTLSRETFSAVTRIVGYNSRMNHWNGSQLEGIEADRKQAHELYAGGRGRDMSWLHNPNGHSKPTIFQFAKTGCMGCEATEKQIRSRLAKQGIEGGVDYVVYHLDNGDERGLAEAAMYDVPLDVFPTVVVAGRAGFWKKTARYATKKGQRSDLIKGDEVVEQVRTAVESYTS